MLGLIALASGKKDEARRRLLASADSQGSPQMNSFGPNMQLAKELLEKGEKDVVLAYFERCGKFWVMGTVQLAAWTEAVKKGEMPKFGANPTGGPRSKPSAAAPDSTSVSGRRSPART